MTYVNADELAAQWRKEAEAMTYPLKQTIFDNNGNMIIRTWYSPDACTAVYYDRDGRLISAPRRRGVFCRVVN